MLSLFEQCRHFSSKYGKLLFFSENSKLCARHVFVYGTQIHHKLHYLVVLFHFQYQHFGTKVILNLASCSSVKITQCTATHKIWHPDMNLNQTRLELSQCQKFTKRPRNLICFYNEN